MSLLSLSLGVLVNMTLLHIKLFPQRDEHLFFSVPGVRGHAHVLRCEFSKWRTG